jgi:CRISPR-associated protein Csm2
MKAQVISPKQPGDFDEKWITEAIDDPFLEFIEGFGFYLVDKRSPNDNRPGRNAMTTSQLRNIFSEAKQIESQIKMIQSSSDKETKWKDTIKPRILLLRPKIAYATARAVDRDRDSRMKAFGEVVDSALRVASKKIDYYKNFIQMFEAIIAYHKKYGGRDK